MTNSVDYDRLFVPKYFVNDAIVTYTKLVESRKIAGQCLEASRIQVRSQPVDTLDDATPCRLV